MSEDAGKVSFILKPGACASISTRNTARDATGSTVNSTKASAASFPLTPKLQRGLPPVANRPQMPHPPFPYRAEDVGYENTVQKVHLAGALTLPEGKGPFPVVLLITRSGQQDRDEVPLRSASRSWCWPTISPAAGSPCCA